MGEVTLEGLLAALRDIVDEPGGGEFTRKNMIRLLRTLEEQLREVLYVPLGELDDGTEIIGEHQVITHFSWLVRALEDLDNGLTDEILKPNRPRASARLPWRIRSDDETLVEALMIFQNAKGFHSRKAAAEALAKKLKKGGYRRKGEPLSAKQLINLSHRKR